MVRSLERRGTRGAILSERIISIIGGGGGSQLTCVECEGKTIVQKETCPI